MAFLREELESYAKLSPQGRFDPLEERMRRLASLGASGFLGSQLDAVGVDRVSRAKTLLSTYKSAYASFQKNNATMAACALVLNRELGLSEDSRAAAFGDNVQVPALPPIPPPTAFVEKPAARGVHAVFTPEDDEHIVHFLAIEGITGAEKLGNKMWEKLVANVRVSRSHSLPYSL